MKSELSNGEWILMNQLWTAPNSSITELTSALREVTGWDKHTILSMLSRLEAKGAVSYRTGGRAKAFYAVLPREDALRREAALFLEKAGDVYRAGRALADSLSRGDAEALVRLLNREADTSEP